MDLERRAATIDAVEGNTLTGYAALYNSWSKPLMGARGEFREQIAPGAFNKSIAAGASLWFMHDSSQILANTKSGTLKLESDDKGLRYTATLGDSARDQGVLDLVRRGVVNEMSFGFRVPEGGDSWSGQQRTLKAVDLREISLVEVGAYSGTSAEARTEPEAPKETRTMTVRELNAKLSELATAEADAVEVDAKAEIRAQIEELSDQRAALLAAPAPVKVAAAERRSAVAGYQKPTDYLLGHALRENRTLDMANVTGVLPRSSQSRIMEYLTLASVARKMFNVQTTASSTQMTVETAMNKALYRAQSVAYPQTDSTLAAVTFQRASTKAEIKLTEELLAESAVDLETYILQLHARQHAQGQDDVILGNAAANSTGGYNTPQGAFNVSWGNTASAVNTTSWTLGTIQSIINTLPMEYHDNAAFCMSQSTWNILMPLLVGTTANSAVIASSSPQFSNVRPNRYSIYGFPVFITSSAPAWTTSTKVILFGDFKRAGTIMDFAPGFSAQIDPYSNGSLGQITFRSRHYHDFRAVDTRAVVQISTGAS
jgi:HK97 family phage major capsid protein/HK97 family phage prohead protease